MHWPCPFPHSYVFTAKKGFLFHFFQNLICSDICSFQLDFSAIYLRFLGSFSFGGNAEVPNLPELWLFLLAGGQLASRPTLTSWEGAGSVQHNLGRS
jgi:hypothetical protein